MSSALEKHDSIITNGTRTKHCNDRANVPPLLNVNFKNFIFFSFYHNNFYYNECVLNFLGDQLISETYSNCVTYEYGTFQRTIQTLNILYELIFNRKVNICSSGTLNIKSEKKCINCLSSNSIDMPVLPILISYFHIAYQHDQLNKINSKLLEKLQTMRQKLDQIDKTNNVRNCTTCSQVMKKLKEVDEKYKSLLKNHASSQMEKEKIVMQYANSERNLINANRSINAAEKKLDITLKENLTLQKKYEKVQDAFRRLNGDIQKKYLEIVALRNRIEHFKAIENTKEMKLTWAQNRLKFISSAYEDIQFKFKESLVTTTDPINEFGITQQRINREKGNHQSRCKNDDYSQYVDQNVHIASDSQSSMNSKIVHSELGKQSGSSLSNKDQNNATPFLNSPEGYVGCRISTQSLEMIGQKVVEIESSEETLSIPLPSHESIQSKEDIISGIESELKQVLQEKAELEIDLELYHRKEVQTSEFIQKLTDENVRLLHDNENLKSQLVTLKNNHSPLQKNVQLLKIEIKSLTSELTSEKLSRAEENEIMAKYVAEQSFFNEKLLNQIEELKGQNVVLVKKYETILKEMLREFHPRHRTLTQVLDSI